MTRNKIILLCARDYKNRPKRKETSILSLEQVMKAGFMVMIQDKTTIIPVEVILLPPKRVEADEVLLQGHVVCFLEQWANSSKGISSSLPACESTVLHRSTEGFYRSCWEKMPDKWCTQDWLLHHDNTPCHTDPQLFPVPDPKKDGGIWPLYFSILVFMAYSGSHG